MSGRLTVLVIGGYGTFGGRIVELLESVADLKLIVAGRSREKAEAFCRTRPRAAAILVAAAFDRNGDVEAQLALHPADVVVDASGPFQGYGERPYRVIEACIARRTNYLDLADGSAFVAGVAALDEAARAAGVFALSGASSFPVLTAAVVRRLSGPLTRVDRIRGGIAPSPFAGVGENVIRAIAGYSGQPVPLRRGGTTVIAYPLTEQRRYAIAPPGRLPLRDTLFSLVDVPDLRVLGDLWPEAAEIWMGAGPTPESLHRCLIGLSWLTRWRWIASLTPLAGLMHGATNRLRWGEPRGGMFVEVVGRDEASERRKLSWHLLAEGDDGPLIPSMAVAAIVRRALDGRIPAAGARAATRELELEDYEALFADRSIHVGWRDDSRARGLYQTILGSAFDALPAEIRDLHADVAVAEGQARVETGEGWLAKLAAKLVGFPAASAETPVRVSFDRSPSKETWTRDFGGKTFHSEQSLGAGRSSKLMVERFGPLNFGLALVCEGGRLQLVLRRWSLFDLPLPAWLGPKVEAYEAAQQGLFHFHVEISHPWIGLIVRYRGWLRPAGPRREDRAAAA